MVLRKGRILKKTVSKIETALEEECEKAVFTKSKRVEKVTTLPVPDKIIDIVTNEEINLNLLNRNYTPPSQTREIPINNEQFGVCKQILEWLHTPEVCRRPFHRLGGLAGTGKTTIITYVINECQQLFPNDIRFKDIVVLTYAWKAALVLRSKGVEASSIHSLFYQVDGIAKDGTPIFSRRSAEEVRGSIGLIIIDEASMVDKEMREDIERYGIPVLYVGDHGQ